MHNIPTEVSIGGVYFPPLLLAAILGVIIAVMTVVLLNRYKLARYFYSPPSIFVLLVVFYTSLIAIFIIPA
jgi:hypothetical protein